MVSANRLQELLTRARAGEQAAEEELFEHLRVRFSAIAKQRLKGDYCEDIAHEACLSVLQKYRELPETTTFEPWAYQILRNKIGTYMRDSKLSNSIVLSVDEIDNLGYQDSPDHPAEIRRLLVSCLRKLARVNRKYIRVLNLTNQGFSTEEICDMVQVKSNHLYVLLHRCRKLLYDCLYKGEGKK